MAKTKVYIDGQAGTTGLQIFDRIGSREDLELMRIDEDKDMTMKSAGSFSMRRISSSCACRTTGQGKRFL